MKICPKCKEHIIFDDVSQTYYCENCNRVYNEDELDVDRQISISALSFVLWIPIINLLILPLTKNRPKDEQTVYTNVALASMLNHFCIVVLIMVLLMNYRDNSNMQFIKEARRSTESTLVVNNIYDKLTKIPAAPTLPKVHEPEETRTLADDYTEEVLDVLDGSKVSGEKVREIMQKYSNYGYLIQTLSAKQKFTEATLYMNYGREIVQCEQSEGGQFLMYKGTIQDNVFTLKPNSFAELDINDSRTIFYIYDTEYFLVKLLYDAQHNVVGMAFIEQEDLL